MRLYERATNVKQKALKEIENAAKTGDTKTIISRTKVIEETDRVLEDLQRIREAIEKLESGSYSPYPTISLQSPRAKGTHHRQKLLEDLRGQNINLTYVKKSLFKTSDGELVGVAYGSEQLPNRWWLGLPDRDYRAIILLCEGDEGETLRFVLPEDFIWEYKSKLSKDANGQIKFNVGRDSGNYDLNIPSVGKIPINEFLNNYDNLPS